ncbi:MAG: MFS transporter [Henriciella sp.]
MVETRASIDRQSNLFLALYTLAWIGGFIAYVPLLAVLLPARVSDISGTDAVSWLAYISFVGAVAASLANIGFGWLSDLIGSRRAISAVGLGLSCILLVLTGTVDRLSSLLVLITLWQLSLNMMLAPLAAWAGDCVPDSQKGLLGGLLSIAPAIGAMAGTFVTLPGLANGQERLWLVALIVVLCVLPVLIFGRPRHFPDLLHSPVDEVSALTKKPGLSNEALRMWLSRLLIQITEAALFAYLLLWLRSLSEAFSDNDTAWVYSLVLLAGIPIAVFAGRWADQQNRPVLPLCLCAAAVSAGLLLMGAAWDLTSALAGYILFGIAGTVFLSLHSAQTLRFLPSPERRGRDLGIFNLTNTVPALIMPWLTLALVPVFGFSALFYLLAFFAAIAFFILFTMPRRS